MLLLTSVLSSALLATVFGQTDLATYRNLPPLYSFHKYDKCFAGPTPSAYCVIFAEIQPENHSDLWLSIEDISSDAVHRFRHDRLFFGLCVEQCKEILETPRVDGKPIVDKRTMDNEITDYYQRVYAGDPNTDRLMYHDLLDRCVNDEFQRKYNLTLLTFVEYCNTSTLRLESKTDYLQIMVYVLIAVLVISNIVSSAYDYYLHCQDLENEDYYRQEVKNLGSTILTSFSVSRNLKKLCVAPNDTDLQFLYFFRVFTMSVVIFGHTSMIVTSAAVENPEYIENYLYRSETIVSQNGAALIQIFFVITGFLLKLKFDQQQLMTKESTWATSISVYILGCSQRYLRIIPSLAFLIFFNASLLTHLGDGPFWRHMVESERAFCTEYWWKNVFMINNFMMEDSCSQQTWYLAADMQLLEFFLIVLIFTTKFPRLKKPLYILIGVLTFLVPGIITYIYRLEAGPYLKPEYYRYLYFKLSNALYITYTPFYCNLGGYLVGIICADIYTKSQRFQQLKRAWKKYTHVLKVQIPVLIIMLALGFGLLFSGLLVVNRSSAEPSIWIALYAACYRNTWAIFGGVALLGMLLKFGWIAYEISCSAIVRVLGRITLQMFLWHVVILKILFGYYRQPVYINTFFVSCQIILAIVLSILVALVMTIFVEYPIGKIINCLLKLAIQSNLNNSSGAQK